MRFTNSARPAIRTVAKGGSEKTNATNCSNSYITPNAETIDSAALSD